MSMTREETIKHLRNDWFMSLGGQLCVDEDKKDAFLEAIGMGIKALRPISREQVEKVFPGCQSCKSCRSCVFSIHQLRVQPCKKCDPNAECALTEYKPSNFCPICGKPLTDEAVEMVIERMEALENDN